MSNAIRVHGSRIFFLCCLRENRLLYTILWRVGTYVTIVTVTKNDVKIWSHGQSVSAAGLLDEYWYLEHSLLSIVKE